MWVIAYGDLFEGFQGVVGPFNTEEAAEDYSETYNLGHFERAIYELEVPAQDSKFQEIEKE